MITTRFTLCALPAAAWAQDTTWGSHTIAIRSFVEDAQGIEHRLAKGVNQDNERARYSLCCSRLEAALMQLPSASAVSKEAFRSALGAAHLPIVTLGAEYLDVIELMYRKAPPRSSEMRLGTTFFPPDLVEAHVAAFSTLATDLGLADHTAVQQRVAFFQLAREHDCGVIELEDPYRFEDAITVTVPQIAIEEEVPSHYYQDIETDERAFDNEGRNAYEILREQVEAAIRCVREGRPRAVNFSNQPHNIITEVLNEFVYSESGSVEKPTYVQVIYTDGSQGEPFPLRCLPKRDEAEIERLSQVQPLRVALLSMRHLALDHDVDMAWFRNREVSKARAFAETDAFCYAQTRKLLQESRDSEHLRLYLYQTGLQPAVIGFFRALVEELVFRAKSPPSLEVVPYYHRSKGGYQQGHAWH